MFTLTVIGDGMHSDMTHYDKLDNKNFLSKKKVVKQKREYGLIKPEININETKTPEPTNQKFVGPVIYPKNRPKTYSYSYCEIYKKPHEKIDYFTT